MKAPQASPGVAAVTLVALTTGCGGISLADGDPEGAKACQAMVDGLNSMGPTTRMGSMFEAGRHAQMGETRTIEWTTIDLVGPQL